MKIIRIFLVIGLLFAGCEILETEVPSSVREMEISFTGLPQLPDTLEYVSWLAGPEGSFFYRVEKFTPVNGSFSKLYTDIKAGAIVGMQYLVLSIEKKGLHDTVLTKPSDVPILAGYLNGNQGEIKFSEDNSMPRFESVKGNYMLATPSDTDPLNETSGIWFVDKDSAGNMIAGLTLPALPKGWFYQGWIEKDGRKFVTGHFQDIEDFDLDAPYSDTTATVYEFPGEDFLLNPPDGVTFPLDLQGAKVYITLQPKYDLMGSYGFRILEGQVTVGSVPGTVYQLQMMTITPPSGTVKLKWQI
jgi:hypothetical protein